MSFGALLLGAYRDGTLHYFGRSGTGSSEHGLKEALERMRPLFTDKSLFVNPPEVPERVQSVRPELICEVTFTERTEDEQLRQTTFLGWRDDKKPEEVLLEKHDSGAPFK